MKARITITGAFLFLLAASAGLAQDLTLSDIHLVRATTMHAAYEEAPVLGDATVPDSAPRLDSAVALPRMSPELALSTYLSLAHRQLTELGAYSDVMVIEADLPDTAQHGKYELRRYFQAPRSLAFATLHFAGDAFVKTNVIARLLQSEMEHVQKGEGAQTAITAENYKFSYKGTETDPDGQVGYIYQVKPRHKRPGMFKGRILLDSATGRLRRAEGTMVKSPSFFVKNIEFVQDYAECGPFSLPVHLHSVAKTRLVGRAVVEVLHTDYRALTVAQLQSQGAISSAGGGNGGSSN